MKRNDFLLLTQYLSFALNTFTKIVLQYPTLKEKSILLYNKILRSDCRSRFNVGVTYCLLKKSFLVILAISPRVY